MILLGIIISIILLALQLTSIIAWPWWAILMPIFITVGINIIIGIIAGAITLIIIRNVRKLK